MSDDFALHQGDNGEAVLIANIHSYLVQVASETEINSIHNQAIRAVNFYRFAVPRKIFLMITGGEDHE
ncbi:hypothetical protein VB715_18650 [Crocosphaera sp. UHCC 0190]|uniref:hypothetical protein n=1 Tax=Crocosphaera sp. UHCC 0190 TaxID=3110246 RepID=UPI002B20BD08|nr:hypothetical protein [Crocosphaera sp. UHCC 0190]MEA5511796.1 hypothetical protein [Crocosphaera sp. UHCC 0190]